MAETYYKSFQSREYRIPNQIRNNQYNSVILNLKENNIECKDAINYISNLEL